MKILLCITFISIQFLYAAPHLLLRGGETGNGGDALRMTFIQIGNEIIKYYEESPTGIEFAQANQINTAELKESLSIYRIVVTDDVLIDNTFSIVDALGVPGLITLNRDAWFELLSYSQNVSALVLHEMLRATNINDDNYIISLKSNAFPNQDVTSFQGQYFPLMASLLLKQPIDPKKVVYNGNGCRSIEESLKVKYNQEQNTLELKLDKMIALGQTPDNNIKSEQMRASCGIALPLQSEKGKKLILTQIDLKGRLDVEVGHLASISFDPFILKSKGKYTSGFKKEFLGMQSGRFLIRKSLTHETPCGGSSILRLQFSALMRGKSPIALRSLKDQDNSDQFSGSYNKIDKVILYLETEDCK